MTTTHHATVRATSRWSLVQALRRWAASPAHDTAAGRRAQRSRRRSPFTPVPAPLLAVWAMDRTELAEALDHARW
jgi:hypothetical protein